MEDFSSKLERLTQLHKDGHLTAEQFEAAKAILLEEPTIEFGDLRDLKEVETGGMSKAQGCGCLIVIVIVALLLVGGWQEFFSSKEDSGSSRNESVAEVVSPDARWVGVFARTVDPFDGAAKSLGYAQYGGLAGEMFFQCTSGRLTVGFAADGSRWPFNTNLTAKIKIDDEPAFETTIIGIEGQKYAAFPNPSEFLRSLRGHSEMVVQISMPGVGGDRPMRFTLRDAGPVIDEVMSRCPG